MQGKRGVQDRPTLSGIVGAEVRIVLRAFAVPALAIAAIPVALDQANRWIGIPVGPETLAAALFVLALVPAFAIPTRPRAASRAITRPRAPWPGLRVAVALTLAQAATIAVLALPVAALDLTGELLVARVPTAESFAAGSAERLCRILAACALLSPWAGMLFAAHARGPRPSRLVAAAVLLVAATVLQPALVGTLSAPRADLLSSGRLLVILCWSAAGLSTSWSVLSGAVERARPSPTTRPPPPETRHDDPTLPDGPIVTHRSPRP